MIISKKKFEQAIFMAKEQREQELFRQRDLDDRFRYVQSDYNDLCKRVYELELKTGIRKETDNGNTANPNYCRY